MAIRSSTNVSGSESVPECDQAWAALPAKMHEEYANPEFVDSGRRGCAFKAHERRTDRDVLVKVGKLLEDNTADWWHENECDPMREMHRLACQKGKQFLDLAEKYLPSCIDFMPFGDNSTQPYFTMHLAPTSQFEEVTRMKWKLSRTARLFLFAQLIESLYTLHELGFVHNDFKGANIMVAKPNEKDIPEVAIIDFGRVQRGFHLSHYHDASLLRKHLATALGCNGYGAARGWFVHCLQDEWQMDPESLKVFWKWDKHLSGNIQARNAFVDQGIAWIYNTRFVQNVIQNLRQIGQKKHYIIDSSCL